MKNLLKLTVVCCYATLSTQAQQIHLQTAPTPSASYHECATHPTSEQLRYLNQNLAERQVDQTNRNNATVYIPVRHIIVRENNGTGGIGNFALNRAMNHLNSAYAPANIIFYECSRTYVNNSTYYNLDTRQEENDLAAITEQANVLNIFYVNNALDACGYAYLPGGPDRVAMNNNCLGNRSTFIHEVGHYLSLLHTHESALGVELVNGTNCSIAGDQICDTPADPNLSGVVGIFCNYRGSATDPNGDSYSPATNNYMSYAPKLCRRAFTPQQLSRARFSALNDRAYLNCTTTSPVSFINDKENLSAQEIIQEEAILSTSVELHQETTVALFPNPVSNILSIDFRNFDISTRLTIRIVDLLGTVQYNTFHTIQDITGEMVELSVEALLPGIYMMVVEDEQGIITSQRFVKR